MAQPLPGTPVIASVSAISLTFPVTVSGTDRFLEVAVHLDSGATVSGVTYDGVAMTLIKDQLGSGPGGRPRCVVFGEIAPPIGTANVVITLGSSVNVTGVAIVYTRVDQATGFNNALGATAKDSTPTVTITSAVDDLVVDAASAFDNGPWTPGAGQTEQYDTVIGTGVKTCSGSTEPGAASVVMDHTIPGSSDWAIVGYNLLGNGGAPPGPGGPSKLVGVTELPKVSDVA